MIHELKTVQPYFDDVASGNKTFEVRKNDREFMVGDFLALNEYDPQQLPGMEYTGRCMLAQVTYILRTPEYCKEGFITMGIDCAGIITHRWSNQPPREIQQGMGYPVYDRECK